MIYFSCRSRQLNAQLERAIQLAMTELDRMASPNDNTPPTPFPIAATSPQKQSEIPVAVTPQTPESTSDAPDTSGSITTPSKNMKRRITRATAAQQRKLIKIAPAPMNNNQSVFRV